MPPSTAADIAQNVPESRGARLGMNMWNAGWDVEFRKVPFDCHSNESNAYLKDVLRAS